MREAGNVPYVKQYDSQGNLINKDKNYINYDANRRQRRESMQKNRFVGNSKNCHLTIHGVDKYHRVLQIVPATMKRVKEELIDLPMKKIYHYILKKRIS